MKFVVSIELYYFIENFQLVKSHVPKQSNETIYIKHDNETTTEEQPKHVHHHNHHSKHNKHKHEKLKKEEAAAAESVDHYTFVALIEVMFNDGSRKNCTGAIIHDNVVITAAHCFDGELDSLQLELTGSFVIIGTKEMFDTGYEQYLPIERVLIHPDFNGWNADIALVYTFAGMMSDKPGNIIPLAEENSFTSLNSNVTVLNWHQIQKKVLTSAKRTKSFLDSDCSQSSEEQETYFHKDITQPVYNKTYDWNRKDTKENILFMEDYTIFGIRSCKQLVQKYKPAIYQIEHKNLAMCYYTRSANKVQANLGALAVHQNHLVAIAAGDINFDNKQIIVGTKLVCYCTWIGENLPGTGGDQIQCCTNCCSKKYLKKIKKPSIIRRK